MTFALALLATLASACALNVGYLLEHRAVRRLPPLSARTPIRSLRLLVGAPRWLAGFSIEAGGWLLFVVALALAPLSLVQATAAGGIGILALLSVRLTGVPLSRSERLGVAVSVGGLALLGISLAGGHEAGGGAGTLTVATWVVASAAAAAAAVRLLGRHVGDGAAYGIATGLLFAAGDVATKGAVEEGGELAFVAALVACYALGTLVLQAGFQHGSPLATAGLATLLTNALPIVAGMTIFSEPLPGGWLGGVRVAAFASVVTGGVFLAERKHGASPQPGGPRWGADLIPADPSVRECGLRRGLEARIDPSEGEAMHETLITPAGLARLSDHLDRLKTQGREEAAQRLRYAISTDADPTANADYLAAREEQAMLERRIADLERRLDSARVAEADADNGVVDVGERVRLREVETGARVVYELVGSLEADPAAGRISIASPLGQALLGRRKGEVAVVEAPRGRLQYKILAIEPAAAAA